MKLKNSFTSRLLFHMVRSLWVFLGRRQKGSLFLRLKHEQHVPVAHVRCQQILGPTERVVYQGLEGVCQRREGATYSRGLGDLGKGTRSWFLSYDFCKAKGSLFNVQTIGHKVMGKTSIQDSKNDFFATCTGLKTLL